MKISRLVLAAAAAMFAPWAMAQSVAPSSGLLITHVNSQQWEVRLISGSAPDQASFVIDSNLPFTALTTVSLESGNSARLLTPTSLGASFSTSPGYVDGVNFSVSANAKLCLRDTGSSGVQIYVGDSLQNATRVTAPVALTTVDACGTVTTPPPTTIPTGGRKYDKGHYIAMSRGADSQALMETVAGQPGVVGIMKRYTWRSLEPSQGVYQFAAIKSDLAWAASKGLRLVVMIEDKTFASDKAGPAYLDAYDVYHAPDGVAPGGWVMKRWHPTVVARFNALVKALGAQVDSNRNFEGIALQESSLSMSPAALKAIGYTPELYRDALINVLSTACASLPTSRVFWFMNFLTGHQTYIANVLSAVAGKGVVMGGPDVWPDNKGLQNNVYPYYTQFQGKLPMFGQVENINYAQLHMTSGYTTKYWTMQELYNYAMTHMHVNYMFWVRITKSPAYNWTDGLKVIKAHPQLN